MEKNHHDATKFIWTTFNCLFETSSDKLQNVSQSVSAVLRQVCLTAVKCYVNSSQCPHEHVSNFLKILSKSVTFFGFLTFTRYCTTVLDVYFVNCPATGWWQHYNPNICGSSSNNWCENVCDVYIENFLTNQLMKKFEIRSTFARVTIKHQGA